MKVKKTPIREKKKYIPNSKAVHFELGYKYRSENSNYIYCITLNKYNNKVWKRVK